MSTSLGDFNNRSNNINKPNINILSNGYPSTYRAEVCKSKPKKKKVKCATLKKIFTLKSALVVLSFIGFTYQATILSDRYFNYPTVVDVDIKPEYKIRLPAVTVCTPIQILPSIFKKLFIKYPEVKQYLDSLDREIKSEVRQAQEWKFLRQFFTLSYTTKVDLNLSSLLSLTVPQEAFIHKCAITLFNNSNTYLQIPCSKISDTHITFTEKHKCFTYFSQHHRINSDELLMSINEDSDGTFISKVYVFLRLNFDLDPEFNLTIPGKIYIHSSKDIMAKSYGYSLDPFFKYEIFYWRSVSERLWPQNCRKYPSFSRYQAQSQVDCIHRCFIDFTRLTCNCVSFRPNLRVEIHDPSIRICPQPNSPLYGDCRGKSFDRYLHSCRSNCLEDCMEENYDFDVIAREISLDENAGEEHIVNKTEKISEVTIKRKLKSDVIYKQKRQMYFEQFFSNIGSLLGFWLGISMLAIYDQVKRLILRVVENYRRHKMKIIKKTRQIKPSLLNI